MRWVLLVLVAFLLIGVWVAAFFNPDIPDLRWVAEGLTIVAVVLPVMVVLFLWLSARRQKGRGPIEAAPAKVRGLSPQIVAARSHLHAVLRDLTRMRGGPANVRRLPWYVALGAKDAGRSSFLEQAGFALVSPAIAGGSRAPRDALFDVRGSPHAVVLEPASSLLLPGETDTWIAMLDALRRKRPRRPLEGIFVVVSIPDLVAKTPHERREFAQRLRSRLDELLERVAMVLPVYVILTKGDALSGFAEFWADDAKREDGSWGASFAVKDDGVTHQPGKAVEKEFDLLGERLHAKMIDRMAVVVDVARRARVLRFPAQVHALAAPLAEFIEVLCRQGPALERFFLRGFYLTSATSGANSERPTVGSKGAFVTDVIRSVVLPDRNLGASTSRSLRARSKFDLIASLVALSVCFLVFVPALLNYLHNVELVRSVQSAGEHIAHAAPASTPGTRGDPVDEALDTLIRLESDATAFGVPGWFGPRAARDLREPLTAAYVLRIHRWMLQTLRPALEKELDTITWGAPLTDAPMTPEESTPLRKAYETAKLDATLVSPKGHANNEWAAQALASEWRNVLPDSDVDEMRLTEHARRYLSVLERRPELAWPKTPALVGVRNRLRQLQVQQMPYRRLLLWARDQPPIRASGAFSAPSLEFLDSRGDVQISGVFTASGWQKIRDALASPAPWPSAAVPERWVLDDAGIAIDDAGVRAESRQRYFADYVDAWMRFLSELHVKTPADIAAAKEELVALKGPDGFYRQLFAVFAQNAIRGEDLEPPPSVEKAALSHVASWLGKAEFDAGARVDAPSPVEKGLRPVLLFAGIVSDEKGAGSAPLDKYLAILDVLKAALDEAPSPKDPVSELQGPVAQAESGVGELLDGTSEPSRTALLHLLIPPVRGSVAAQRIPGQASVAEEWNSGVWTVWDQKLSKDYPFRNGDAVNFGDFAAFFKPDGILWSFVHTYLAGAVEEKGDGRYVSKGLNPVTPAGLECLTVSQEITDAFFQGPDPGLRFSVQADWTAPDVKDAKFWVGTKDTTLAQGQWSALLHWFGEDVRVEWLQGGRPTQEFGRHAFSLFDLFGHLGGLQASTAAHPFYMVDCAPLTLRVRSDARVDAFRPDFFSRLRCPAEVQIAHP